MSLYSRGVTIELSTKLFYKILGKFVSTCEARVTLSNSRASLMLTEASYLPHASLTQRMHTNFEPNGADDAAVELSIRLLCGRSWIQSPPLSEKLRHGSFCSMTLVKRKLEIRFN